MLDNLMNLIRATEIGAICASQKVGSKDKNLVDQYAVDAINSILSSKKFSGEIVLGEGELDEAPMLYVGQKFNDVIEYDIAIDPVEGTTPAAMNLPGAISTIATSKKGTMAKVPEMYMEKLFVSPQLVKAIDVSKNIKEHVVEFQKISSDLTVVVLDKPRHNKMIEWFKSKGIKVILITDGDVMGAIQVVHRDADFLWGIGGSPEGGLMASLAIASRCEMAWSLVEFDSIQTSKTDSKTRGEIEKKQVNQSGQKYNTTKLSRDLVNDDKAAFVATAITDSGPLSRVRDDQYEYFVTTIYARAGSVRIIESSHNKKELRRKYKELKDIL